MIPPRDNPFAAARFAPGVLPWVGELEPLVDRVCAPNARLQILGPHGSGKSTLLVHLARHAAERGFRTHSFRGSQGIDLGRLFAHRPGSLVVFADEFEELAAPSVLLLRASCALLRASLVVTTHRDLGMETLCERTIDVQTVRALCSRLLAGAAPPPDEEELEASLRRHHGNVREVFFELYDAAAAR